LETVNNLAVKDPNFALIAVSIKCALQSNRLDLNSIYIIFQFDALDSLNTFLVDATELEFHFILVWSLCT